MGFVLSTPKVTLEAYYTQLGRKYLISGTTEQSKIKYFSLNDPDVNYYIAVNNNGNDEKNVLPTGFVVDITGDKTDCIKSVSNGINQKYFTFGDTTLNTSFTTLESRSAFKN